MGWPFRSPPFESPEEEAAFNSRLEATTEKFRSFGHEFIRLAFHTGVALVDFDGPIPEDYVHPRTAHAICSRCDGLLEHEEEWDGDAKAWAPQPIHEPVVDIGGVSMESGWAYNPCPGPKA